MTDIGTISAVLTSLKTATDIAKAIRSADVTLERAEIKLKMADLIESLADAKINAAEIQDILREKDEEIGRLEEAFQLNSKLIRKGDAYFEVGEDGNVHGDPYCPHCWEVNHRAVHLNYGINMLFKECPACKTQYDRRRTH